MYVGRGACSPSPIQTLHEMNEIMDLHIAQEIEDAVMERPHAFSVDGERFALYPVSLGKSILISRLVQKLGIDAGLMATHPSMAAIKASSMHKDIVCRIIAYCTAPDKCTVFDAEKIETRQMFFSENLTDDETARLLLMILRYDSTASFIRHLGLDKEQKDQAEISRLKNRNGNSMTFGGKSVYGALIGVACEKFGWTLDYVVWGISLVNLRMMIADSFNSVYLSEDERKSLRLTTGRQVLDMDNPRNWDKIKSMKWD